MPHCWKSHVTAHILILLQVAAIIVVVCIGDALAKQGAKSHSSPKSISGPNSSSSSGSGSSHERDKWCDAAPLFKKEDHCEHVSFRTPQPHVQ